MDPGDSDQEDPLYLDLVRGPDIIHIDTHTHRVYPLEGIGYVETTNLKEQALQHTTMVAEPVLRIIMSTLRIRYQFNTEDNSFMLLTPVTDAIRAIQLLAQHHKRGTKYKKFGDISGFCLLSWVGGTTHTPYSQINGKTYVPLEFLRNKGLKSFEAIPPILISSWDKANILIETVKIIEDYEDRYGFSSLAHVASLDTIQRMTATIIHFSEMKVHINQDYLKRVLQVKKNPAETYYSQLLHRLN